MSMAPIAVVGAGIIGVCIAHALRRRGLEVVLIDRNAPGTGCSFGNLGAISASSVVPLATPGVIRSLPAMLFNASSPLYLRWSYLPQAAPWLIKFIAAARPAAVAAASAALADLHKGAVAAHEALAGQVGVPELILTAGQLHLYPDKRALQCDASAWMLRKEKGIRVQELDRAGLLDLEPNVGPGYRVAMYLQDDATILNPRRYVQAIASHFVRQGGQLVAGDVTRIVQTAENAWQVRINGADTHFGDVVIASGAWAKTLLAQQGVDIPLETQRGYHVQFDGHSDLVRRSVVLADKKIFLAPMEDGLRAGGTVEFAGLRARPDYRRSALLEQIVRKTFPAIGDARAAHWMGHRPCMPDSLPRIGPVGTSGLWLAVGHGHLGMTDSVHTSKEISRAIAAKYSALGYETMERALI